MEKLLPLLTTLLLCAGCQSSPSRGPSDATCGIPTNTHQADEVSEAQLSNSSAHANLAAYSQPEQESKQNPQRSDSELPPMPDMTAPETGWTIDDLQEIALNNNPTLRLAQREIEKEKGNWTQVGLYPNPVAGYLRSDPDKSSQSHTNGAFVQQTFITAGKLRLAREQESFGIKNTVQGLQAQRHRVLNDLESRFYEVLGTQNAIDLAHQVEKTAVETVVAAKKAERIRQVSRIDVIRAELQLKRIRLALHDAEEQHAAAWQHLVDMAGVPSLPSARVIGDLEAGIPELDQDQEWERLRTGSPLFQQLNAQVGIARKGLQLARAQRVPDVTGQVVVERDSTNQSTNVQTLVAMPIPLFNRNQGGIYSAYSEMRRAETEIERSELALRDAFTLSFHQYASARHRVQTLKQEVLPTVQENLELTIRGREEGEFALKDVLEARQAYFETQLEYVTALTEVHVAATEVQGMQLTGGLNPSQIGTALQGAEGSATQRRAVQQLLNQQNGGQLKKFTPGTTGE